jgi:hypothetical protein
MARSVKKAWNEPRDPAAEEAVVKQAREIVRAKQESSRENLLHLQGLEIKHLGDERKWIAEQKARDVSAFDNKEIAAINQRYDRLVHRMEQRNNSFLAKFSRVFGGHKRQQRRIENINSERDRVVAERTKQHVRNEAQRQRSLSERDVRVEKDILEAREKHAEAREKQRHAHEHGFEKAVEQEVHRLRQVQQPRPRM